jgi:hypothetical protein
MTPRGVKRKMSNFNVRHRGELLHQRHQPTPALRIRQHRPRTAQGHWNSTGLSRSSRNAQDCQGEIDALGDIARAKGMSQVAKDDSASAASRQRSPSISRARGAGVSGEGRYQAMTNTMIYKGYAATMIFDAEDKIIVGRVLDIDDIISFHGESVPEFESNFHAVVDDYIAASEALGSPPEKHARQSLRAMCAAAPNEFVGP